MDPVTLKISGFLSYQQPVSLEFDGFDLACITGANGAGKSTLLDAITWALFGKARSKDDAVINSQSTAAEVTFDFRYEEHLYRVRRYKPSGKTTQLDFFVRAEDGSWKTLSERSLRETEERIRESLRLEYETFTNASFFLQGKADQFTNQNAGQRKKILTNILGLDIWEVYKERAAARRKRVEAEKLGMEGQLAEIDVELAEEAERRAALQQKSEALEHVSQAYKAREVAFNLYRQQAAGLLEKKKSWEELQSRLKAARARQEEAQTRLNGRQSEADRHRALLARAAQIEAAHADWQTARLELEKWDSLAARHREQEKQLEAPRRALAAEEARLSERRGELRRQAEAVRRYQASLPHIQQEAARHRQTAAELEEQLQQREALQTERGQRAETMAGLESRNRQLNEQMDALKERIDHLEDSSGATCPLCGQPLSETDRLQLIETLNKEDRDLAEQNRQNQADMQAERPRFEALKAELDGLTRLERELPGRLKTAGDAEADLAQKQQVVDDWLKNGQPVLDGLEAQLQGGDYLPEIRASLAKLESELNALGYDPAAHEQTRQRERAGREAEGEMQALRSARAALEPLEEAVADLQKQCAEFQREADGLAEQEARAAEQVRKDSEGLPDLEKAEQELRTLKETENRARAEVGAANQRVEVLKGRKQRREALSAERDELGQQVLRYKELERAFGKDGIQALLIEQALPEIEQEANDLLDRLSGGTMSVRFITQRDYKDKKRADMEETLDILIADSVSERPYEMFSGGEAFRVNFAIRLALSRVLSQRAGARLQMLVIDEGFGSQDAQGRQRLIEAINLVRADFAKILVITHMEELKDAFPNRIEVEKTPQGSTVRVVAL